MKARIFGLSQRAMLVLAAGGRQERERGGVVEIVERETEFPEDARFHHVVVDQGGMRIGVVVESEEFEDVPEHMGLPWDDQTMSFKRVALMVAPCTFNHNLVVGKLQDWDGGSLDKFIQSLEEVRGLMQDMDVSVPVDPPIRRVRVRPSDFDDDEWDKFDMKDDYP